MKDIEVLYKDKNVLVCIKPSGVLSQSDTSGNKSMQDFFEEELFCVHRLDREVSGVMVYALNSKSAAKLSAQIQNGDFSKEYMAVVHGCPCEQSGYFEDLLFKDSKKNKSYVVKRERRGVKKAKLFYEVLATKDDLSLVKIKLYTGRTHQIRVQFSSRQMPLFADKKYGGKDEGKICLYSHSISFGNFTDGKEMKFQSEPPAEYPWNMSISD